VKISDKTHTHTLSRTPLDEGSDSRRDRYLTTHNIHKTQIFMQSAGFETAIPQTHTSDQLEMKNTKCFVTVDRQ